MFKSSTICLATGKIMLMDKFNPVNRFFLTEIKVFTKFSKKQNDESLHNNLSKMTLIKDDTKRY